ncbi:hypothetical protein SARC_15570, partial [Sphaeroforma arctica JP610]
MSDKSKPSDARFLAQWPYFTDFGDHFETPKQAYEDLKPLLDHIARKEAKDRSKKSGNNGTYTMRQDNQPKPQGEAAA